MTAGGGVLEKHIFRSPADWVSPCYGPWQWKNHHRRMDNPVAGDGRKVVLSDTDHLWGMGGNPAWVWKSFCRGLNVLFMDPFTDILGKNNIFQSGNIGQNPFNSKNLRAMRQALGQTRKYALKVDLAQMRPHAELASSRYCLASPRSQRPEYLVYVPSGKTVTVDLRAVAGKLAVEWFDPATGKSRKGKGIAGGKKRLFTVPFAHGAVLYLAVQ
jgi:hypothetical protein